MQNIIEILKANGIEVPEEKVATINKAVAENYKTVSEVEKKTSKLESERDSWKDRAETAEETLKGFDGKDFDTITRERDEWKKKAEDAEKEFTAKEAEREKQELLKEAFTDVKFTSESAKKAIMAQIAEGVYVKNGKLIGFNDLLEEAKKSDADAFATEQGAGRITSGLLNGGNSASSGTRTKKDIDDIKDTRERQRAIAESIARNEGIYQQSK